MECGWLLLVIVKQVDVASVTFLETEDDPQVRRHPHRPTSPAISLEGVQPVPRQSQVVRIPSRPQSVQDAPDSRHEGGRQSAGVAAEIEPTQALVAEGVDHGSHGSPSALRTRFPAYPSRAR